MRRASASSPLFLLSRTLFSSPTPLYTRRPIRSTTHRPPPTTTTTPFPHKPTLFHRFPSYPLRCFSETTVKAPPFDPVDAFEAATTTDDILAAFGVLESQLGHDDVELGLACLKVGQHLDSTGHPDQEKALSFARRALEILEPSSDRPITVAMALHLLGSISYNLQRFRDSLGYLNRASRVLGKTDGEDNDDEIDVKPVKHAVELLLANTKTALGRREEAIVNLRICLELKESMFDPDSRELGVAYRDLAEAYIAVLDFKEALPLCLKAVDIHERLLGRNSVEVAQDRRLLGIIYSGLEEHQKALEQNQLSQKVMKNWGLNSDILNAEIEAANMQIAMGKYNEAVSTLKDVAQEADKDSHTRALVFISMAKALCAQEKVVDAKRCLEISCGILEKMERNHPQEAAEGYADIAEIYENMSEFETAIPLLKRAVMLFEKLPQEQFAEANASARIGWLMLLTGKVQEGIPYLESAAERLKESFGPKHYAVGYIYNNLGAAYMELERPQSAAQMFSLAKDIMDVSLGRHHADTIGACQNLANAYDTMGNLDLALEFQKQAVDAWEKHGPTGAENLQAAKRRLQEIEKNITKKVLDVWQDEITKLKDKRIEASPHGTMPQGAEKAPSAGDKANSNPSRTFQE